MATQTTPKEWFSKTTQVEQVYDESQNKFQDWFHGVISRRESELLLKDKPVGCFLIRVSESRFGYTLSFRAKERTRHYMISQLKNHKFVIIGENKVHRTLNALVDFYSKNKLSNWDGFLTTPCGQREGECDYIDLIPESRLYHVLEEQGRGTRRHPRVPTGTSLYTAAYDSVPGGQRRAPPSYDVPPDRRSRGPAPLPPQTRPPALTPGQALPPQTRPPALTPGQAPPPEGEYQVSQGLYQAPPGVSGPPPSQPPEGVYQVSRGLYQDPPYPLPQGAPPIPSRGYDQPRDLRTPGDPSRSRMAGRPLPSVPGPAPLDPPVPPRGEVYQRLLQNQQNQHNGSGQQQQHTRLSAARGQPK